MRIWMFNHDACMPSTGPLLRHFNFAKELIARGHEAAVFASNHIHFNGKVIDTGNELSTVVTEDGVPFVYVKTTPYEGNGMSRIKNMVSYYRALFPVTKEYAKKTGAPDIIIGSSVHPLACVAGIKIAKRYGIPAIAEIRDLWPEAIYNVGYTKQKSLMGHFLDRGERWIYEKADAVIFLKPGDHSHIEEMGWDRAHGGKIDMGKCYYINNGVNLQDFREAAAQPFADTDLSDDSFRLIYTGTIRKVNNVGKILDAAALLKDEKKIRFLIYGTGVEVPMLQERIENEKLENVKLKGFAEKRKIPYILSRAGATLLNYSQEQYNWSRGSSSNKLFEYMAAGRPVISTVKMGYDFIDKYGCGISLEEQTPQALAEAVRRVYRMPQDEYEAMSERAAEGAKDFDFGILTEKLLGVIEEVRSKRQESKDKKQKIRSKR